MKKILGMVFVVVVCIGWAVGVTAAGDQHHGDKGQGAVI